MRTRWVAHFQGRGPVGFWDLWRRGMGTNVVPETMATPGTEVTGILRRHTGNIVKASVQLLGNEATCKTIQRLPVEPRVQTWREAPKEFPKRKADFSTCRGRHLSRLEATFICTSVDRSRRQVLSHAHG